MTKYYDAIGLGIAGNFALHLQQAGELEEFKEIITEDEAAPKGMFPFYLPSSVTNAKDMLNIYPISHDRMVLPREAKNVQAEPEVALLCDITYKDDKIESITPTHFGAYNDCSIRVAGANKISDKKNWGANSKGFASNLIAIDKFAPGGIMDSFSIASFLLRNDELHPYGEDVELTGYSYFYDKLLNWILNQINSQEDFGPLEPLHEYIHECSHPPQAIISIGATRYTEFGEKTFLRTTDEITVVVYNHTQVNKEDLIKAVKTNVYDNNTMSVLTQVVF